MILPGIAPGNNWVVMVKIRHFFAIFAMYLLRFHLLIAFEIRFRPYENSTPHPSPDEKLQTPVQLSDVLQLSFS
jgi:hypothetical protein